MQWTIGGSLVVEMAFFGVTAVWRQNDTETSTLDTQAGVEKVCSGLMRLRMGARGDEMRRPMSSKIGNIPCTPENDPEGAQ